MENTSPENYQPIGCANFSKTYTYNTSPENYQPIGCANFSKTYTYNTSPENYQPIGCANFSKTYTPNHVRETYTNLDTMDTEQHEMSRLDIMGENGKKKCTYHISSPFVNNKRKRGM